MPVCHHLISTQASGVYETHGKIGDCKFIFSTHPLIVPVTCTSVINLSKTVYKSYVFTIPTEMWAVSEEKNTRTHIQLHN